MIIREHLEQIWRHRTLVTSLVGKELKGRYRGSVLGFFWTFLNPLLLLLVYALVFAVYFRIKMENYSVFMFTGLLPWLFFSQAVSDGAGAISDGGSLVTKVLFPQQILPTVKVVAAFMNYLFSLPILAGFMLVFGMPFKPCLAAFPLVALITFIYSMALALFLATANVFMRDTRHILASILTLWFFLTPILYPLTQVPARFRFMVFLNPNAIFITAFQDIFYWGRWPRWDLLGALALGSLILLWFGIVVFERHKEYFAEKV